MDKLTCTVKGCRKPRFAIRPDRPVSVYCKTHIQRYMVTIIHRRQQKAQAEPKAEGGDND